MVGRRVRDWAPVTVVLVALPLAAVLFVVLLGRAAGDASRSLVAAFRDPPSADDRAADDVEALAAELETWLERRPYAARTGTDLARAAVSRHEASGPEVTALEAAGDRRGGTTEFVLRIRVETEYQMGWWPGTEEVGTAVGCFRFTEVDHFTDLRHRPEPCGERSPVDLPAPTGDADGSGAPPLPGG